MFPILKSLLGKLMRTKKTIRNLVLIPLIKVRIIKGMVKVIVKPTIL